MHVRCIERSSSEVCTRGRKGLVVKEQNTLLKFTMFFCTIFIVKRPSIYSFRIVWRNLGTDAVERQCSGHSDKRLKLSIFSLELTMGASITFNSLSSATLMRPPGGVPHYYFLIFSASKYRNSLGQWLMNAHVVILFSIEFDGNAMCPHLCKLIASDACKSNCLNNG